MTINIGWHWGGNIFLIADTAVTHRSKAYTQSTSFNELVVSEHSRTVEEMHSKIVSINTHTVAAISGDMSGATFFIDELRRERMSNLVEAISVVATGRRTHEHPLFNLLIGAYDGKSTKLIQFVSSDPTSVTEIPALFDVPWLFDGSDSDSDSGDVDKAEDAESVLQRVAFAGSAAPSLRRLLSLMVVVMAAQENDAQRLLVGATGFMQSQGIRNYLLEEGVGGTMLGAVIDKHGTHWLPDVTYQVVDSLSRAYPVEDPDDVHDPDPEGGPLEGQPERVSCAVRDGVGFVYSSYHPGQLAILEQYGVVDSRKVEPQAMIDHLYQGDLPFFVLIGSATGDIVIVDRRRDKDAHVAVRGHAFFITEDVIEFFMRVRPLGEPSRVVFLPAGKQRGLFPISEHGPNANEIRRLRNRQKRERRRRKGG